MNNEKKETTTFRKILKGLGITILLAGTGLAIYDHREQIGSFCKTMSKKLFTKKAVSSNENGAKPSTNNYKNNPRRINNNIRRN